MDTGAIRSTNFKHLQSKTQKELRAMQDVWWDCKAEEIQGFADCDNSKKFFSTLKTIYGPSRPSITPLLSADGNILLKDKTSIIKRWREHFSDLLNKPSAVAPLALDSIPKKYTLNNLDLPPNMEEIRKAIYSITLAGTSYP